MSTTLSNPNAQSASPSLSGLAHDLDGHVVQLYTDDRFLIDVLSRFVGGALAVGDGAIVVATRSHHQELSRQLSARGLDTATAAAQGRYVTLDASELLQSLMVNGAVDRERFNESIGSILRQVRGKLDDNARIAVFGEMVALLWAEEKPQEAVRLEQFWNQLGTIHSFSLLCAYPITGFTSGKHIEPFLRICAEHSSVVPSEVYLTLGSEEERLRSIAHLQQKAHVLEQELELRQSEARFRLLVETVRDYAIFMLDPMGNVSTWNLGAERIKGYKAADIIGKHFSCFYCEEDLRSGKPQWELVIAAKEGRFEDLGWRLRKDGSKFWANVIITAMRDESGKLIGFAKVTRDITDLMRTQEALKNEVEERRQAEKHLSESQKSLRQLSLHLLRTQDEERRRIGRDLHDSLGQYLAVLKMKLDSLSRPAGRGDRAGEMIPDLTECLRLTEDSIKELRTVSYLLYPPMLEEMGLKSAIPWYLEGFSARSGIKTTFDAQADVGRLPRDSELALFRVLQESLTNVHRHSGSDTARVRLLTREGMGVLEIEDDGKGMPDHLLEQSGKDWLGALGVGLRGMNERMRQLGGRLEVARKEGKGTIVSAIVPVEEISGIESPDGP